jgi:hypothetical protein
MSRFRVQITDQITEALVAGAEPRSYLSPPQSEEEAQSLIDLPLGPGAVHGPGPWTQAVAGGRRLIELNEVHQP